MGTHQGLPRQSDTGCECLSGDLIVKPAPIINYIFDYLFAQYFVYNDVLCDDVMMFRTANLELRRRCGLAG